MNSCVRMNPPGSWCTAARNGVVGSRGRGYWLAVR